MLDLYGTPRHEQLYQYSRIKAEHARMNSQAMAPDMTFAPSINTSFECEKTRMNFFQRQQADCRDREYKQKLREEANSTANLRKSMRPSVNRPVTELRGDLGKSLYDNAFKIKSQLEQARELSNEVAVRMSNEQKILSTSKTYMEDLFKQRLIAIFDLMDSDGDGLISANKINVEALDPLVCKVLSPFLIKLSETPTFALDQITFLGMMDKYLKVAKILQKIISVPERRILIGLENKKAWLGKEGPTFQVDLILSSQNYAKKAVKYYKSVKHQLMSILAEVE